MQLIMKTQILIFFSLISSHIVVAQKYISLEELNSKYDVKEYNFSLSSFGIERAFEVYNIERGEDLLLITILPDLKDGYDWIEVQKSELQEENFVSYRYLIDKLEVNNNLSNKYFLVKKIGDQIFRARLTNLQLFKIVNLSDEDIQISGKNVLNLGGKQITKEQVYIKYKKQFPDKVFLFENGFGIPSYLESVYLYDVQLINNEQVYFFWVFNTYGGIGNLAYVKGKGIVAGRYPYYFSLKTGGKIAVSNEPSYLLRKVWDKNDAENKMMWAKELFPERQ